MTWISNAFECTSQRERERPRCRGAFHLKALQKLFDSFSRRDLCDELFFFLFFFISHSLVSSMSDSSFVFPFCGCQAAISLIYQFVLAPLSNILRRRWNRTHCFCHFVFTLREWNEKKRKFNEKKKLKRCEINSLCSIRSETLFVASTKIPLWSSNWNEFDFESKRWVETMDRKSKPDDRKHIRRMSNAFMRCSIVFEFAFPLFLSFFSGFSHTLRTLK